SPRSVTLNRLDLVGLPVPEAGMLWRNRQVKSRQGKAAVEVIVEGVTEGSAWVSGLKFLYSNEESLTCQSIPGMPASTKAGAERIAFLPPMSGLVANETRLEPGAINVRLGEG